ncbi:MAG TPA: cobalamin-binding protein [Terracidiphilus sp.]|nr:cobalamin-binding protein [Terracidiphilus sp.]
MNASSRRIEAQVMPVAPGSLSRGAGLPRRIVCLTDETTETLYRLGEQDRIAGVSAYAMRPPEARTKPRVSAFKNAHFEKILALAPDLVLTFSDVQAEIASELIRRGVTVLAFNQRSVQQILEMIATLSRIVGKEAEGEALIGELQRGLEAIAESAKRFPRRPRVYFEEWNDPLITGIEWVEELIEMAGGEPVFPELRKCGKAQDRVVIADEVIARDPEVILASWCGKRVKKNEIKSRAAWGEISAVRNGQVYEIPSTCILQPGPASLTEGVRQIHRVLAHVAGVEVAPGLMPEETIALL